MGSTSEPELTYPAFLEKVKRTVFIYDLSPKVTDSVLRSAIDQFGMVKGVQILQNYAVSGSVPSSALVEMKNSDEAKAVVSELTRMPFMVLGMPRPVRARAAVPEMFEDRPPKPGRKIEFRWVEPGDPDFAVAQEMKRKVQKHEAEASFLLKYQLEEEEKLAKHQMDTLKANYKKFEIVQSVMEDHTARDLARCYDMKILDD